MTVLQESIEVSRPVHEAFAYISDFTTTQEWDSTATRAEKLTPGPINVGTSFLVNCAMPLGSVDIEYEVVALQDNREIELAGKSRFFDIRDRIQFTAIDGGTRIDYRAEFLFPPAVKSLATKFESGLRRMGKHSMAGMREALEDAYAVPEEKKRGSLSERLVLPGLAGFTRHGYNRARKGWHPMSAYMRDRHAVITGASAGLGRATAMELARRGARLTLVVRDQAKGEQVQREIAEETGNQKVALELADLSLLADVDRLVGRLRRRNAPIDILINNAGALFNPRAETPEGIEQSLALLLLSPYRLTEGLKPLLEKSSAARVINVVSGGMYSQRLDLSRLLEEQAEKYSGSVSYARAKRALMVVTEEWARDWAGDGIVVNAMHPGWADTPGVQSALPEFRRLTRAVLRNAEQGADTIVWLACATEAGKVSGKLFLDRLPQPTHFLKSTRESTDERQALMDYLSGQRLPAASARAARA